MDINITELKAWIAALRSGKYPQSFCHLQSDKGYCIFGVGCRVLIPEDRLRLNDHGHLIGSNPSHQPHAPRWLTEINDHYAKHFGPSLINLNDNGVPFVEIADRLERAYLSTSIEQLLVPRWLVLGDWPGRERGKYDIGDIITDSTSPKELPRDQNGNLRWKYEWEKYPRLFKRLMWFEERNLEELSEHIKFIRDTDTNEVYQVFKFDKFLVLECFLLDDSGTFGSMIPLERKHIPATEEDYNQYLASK